jgi:UDP-N-acetyl-D-galactosamine dehydrogenase
MNTHKIAVIGLGYIGLPLAVEFGKKFEVIGFDINLDRISQLNNGEDKTLEVTKAELSAVRHLIFSNDPNKIQESTVFIITVPTPIDSANRPDLTSLTSASETVARALKPGGIVIYESTVFPGCTEEICAPILEKISGLRYNQEFYCGYSPERINPGDKVNTLTKIKKVTSGSTPAIAEVVDNLYKSIILAGTYKVSSIKVAEAAKVIENTQRDLNIALINELSVLFNRLDIDTLEVLEAAGSKWNFMPFRPGMVGGHCIGVDPYYLTHKAEQVGYHPQIILAGRRINDNMALYVARNTIRLMLRNGIDVARSRIAVLGVTFKENLPDIRNSKVIDLIRELEAWGVEVIVSDPYADPTEVAHKYKISLTVLEDLGSVDALIVAVGHNEYRSIELEKLKTFLKGNKPLLVDVKGLFNRELAKKLGLTIFRL